MSASLVSPADLVNDALARIGYKGPRVANLYDGSMVAKKALDIYAQTRDELLRMDDWDFAERNVSMTLLKSAPVGGYFPPTVWTSAYPSPPWYFSYAYPSDCLKVRSIRATPLFVIDLDPEPVTFSVENDNALVPPAKVILCNVPDAILTYTGQITTPSLWEPAFVEAFAAALGRRLAPSLVGLDATKLAAADENAATQTAEMERG